MQEPATKLEALPARSPLVGPRSESDRAVRSFIVRRLLLAADVLAIALALLVSFSLFGVRAHPLRDFAAGLLLLPLWALLFKVYGLYDRDTKRISHSTVDDVPWVFHAMVFGALGLWTCFRVSPLRSVDLAEGISFFAIGFIGVLAARAAVRELLSATTAAERVLLVADGAVTDVLVRKILCHPEYRLAPVGYLQAERESPTTGAELPRLGAVAASAMTVMPPSLRVRRSTTRASGSSS